MTQWVLPFDQKTEIPGEKSNYTVREIKVYLSRLSSFSENSDTTEIEAPNVERSGIFYCNGNQYFLRGRGGCNWSVKIKT